MPFLLSASRRAIRCSLIAIAAIVFTGTQAWGQGASPQLLPYTVNLLAGGAAATVTGTACPTKTPAGATLLATDTIGDGCLSTDASLTKPRFVIEDTNGNIFFSDNGANLIRRIDATTGIITVVAGGGATTYVSGTSISNTVLLHAPAGLAFAANGDLYFSETATSAPIGADIKKITATAGFITGPGVLTTVAGNGAFGYAVNSTTPPVVITTGNALLDGPWGLAFTPNGVLIVSEEFKQAVLGFNFSGGPLTAGGVTIPAGTVSKIMGNTVATTGGVPSTVLDCPNGTTGTFGCSFGTFVSGDLANTQQLDAPYADAVDTAGNIYVADEFLNSVGMINSSNIVTLTLGNLVSTGTKGIKRGPANTIGIGSDFGLATDLNNNLYVSDALNGYVWRVDATNKNAFVVAGGGTGNVCSAGDSSGNGCPALQAIFVSSGSTFATAANPGISGLFADAAGNLLTTETANVASPAVGFVRKIASGTQFGTINNSHPVNTLDVHFDVGDTFSSSVAAATLTAGAANFTVGSFSAGNCTFNSDLTTDCLLSLTANPPTPGAFTGTLQITSALGKVGNFNLSGNFINVVSPTTTKVTLSAGGCSVTTATGSGSATTITAKVTGQIPGTATGPVNFFVDGTQVGSSNLGTANSASFAYTFPQGPHTYFATYAGDANYSTSTSSTGNVTSGLPTFTMAPVCNVTTTPCPTASQENKYSVVSGGTALYAFSVTPVAYNGTVSFFCSGLPSGAACIFYPGDPTLPSNTLSVTSCGGPYDVALSITTLQMQPVVYGIGALGKGKWAVLGMLPAILLGMVLTFRRRIKYRGALIAIAFLIAIAGTVGCNASYGASASGTPSGTYNNIIVTGVTGNGLIQTQTITLTVQ